MAADVVFLHQYTYVPVCTYVAGNKAIIDMYADGTYCTFRFKIFLAMSDIPFNF